WAVAGVQACALPLCLRLVGALFFERRRAGGRHRMCAARATALKEKCADEAKARMSAGGGDKRSAKAKSGTENFPYPIADAGEAGSEERRVGEEGEQP